MKEYDESGAPNLDDEIEEFLGNRLQGTDLQLSASETLELIHELKSQQLKIETLEAKLKLAYEQPRYNVEKKSDIHSDSTVGYLSLNREGLIIESNRKAADLLNREQSSLNNTLLVSYISGDSKSIFRFFLAKIFSGSREESCELSILNREGTERFFYLTGIATVERALCRLTLTDITQTKIKSIKREEILQSLMNIQAKSNLHESISELIGLIREWSGCEAVGIRLKDGDDFPYFETAGFSSSYVKAENNLCTYGINGEAELEPTWNTVVSRQSELLKPFYTSKGSFWSNKLSDLLSNNPDINYQMHTLNKCSKEGYESISLIAIRNGDRLIGLLQLNDKLPDRFTPYLIDDLEKMADYLAVALLRKTDSKVSDKREKYLNNLIENLGDAVIATDNSGRIKFMNSVAEDMTGWKLSEAKQKPVEDVFRINMQRTLIEEEKANGGAKQSGYYNNRTILNNLVSRNGTEIPIDGRRNIVKNKKGKKTGILFVFRDISEQRRIEKEIIRAKEKAEENDITKSAFLANMSHEIRTPMNGILGFAELLKNPDITAEEREEYIGLIEKSGERMLNIVNDIICISKVEAGQMKVSVSETNANDQIDFIYKFFKHEAEQKGINLLYKTPLSAKDSIIKTDKEKIYAVLTNLVKNAIKFTPEGTIELGYEKKGNFLEFFVRDTGYGIPPAQQGLIFERFKQADVPLAGKYESSGLGLSISKAYVEMLGGEIRVESEVGKGSVFYFTLPYVNGREEEKNGKTETNEKRNSTNEENVRIRKLKILIVDDDDVSTLFLQKVISKYSREILKVRTGREAIETCQNVPDIDLVLMDIEMPETDGYQATREIRKFDHDIVIIAETAFALYNDSAKALEAGCTDYISKPINLELLNDIINKHFFLSDIEQAKNTG